MDVVNLNAERDRRQADAWAVYAEARQCADRTLKLEDGLRATRAWRAFLETIQTPAETAFLNGTVAAFGRRA